MNIDEILQAIDKQITQLQQARALLTGSMNTQSTAKRRGRPAGSANKPTPTIAPATKKSTARSMSADGRARIAAAQKARWAAKKKMSKTPKPVALKQVTPKTAPKPSQKPAGKKKTAAESAALKTEA